MGSLGLQTVENLTCKLYKRFSYKDQLNMHRLGHKNQCDCFHLKIGLEGLFHSKSKKYISKWKLIQRSLKWAQSRCSSFIRLDAVQHWSWHVVLDMTKNFIFWQSDFWPPCTVFNAVAKRIELEQWDLSYVEALSKGFHYLFLFFHLH